MALTRQEVADKLQAAMATPFTVAQLDAQEAALNAEGLTIAEYPSGVPQVLLTTTPVERWLSEGNPKIIVARTTIGSVDVWWNEVWSGDAVAQVGGLSTGSGGVRLFTQLEDTPGDYSGYAGQILRVNAAEDALEYSPLPSGTAEAPYRFDTSVGIADPGSGRVQLNNADPALATVLSISSTDDNNVSRNALLGFITDRDILLLRDLNSDDVYVYQTSGPGQDNTGWWQFNVTSIEVVGTLKNNEAIIFAVWIQTVNDFVDLADTPSSYVGEARRMLSVTDAEDGLEFKDEPMRWRDVWVPQQYFTNDTVIDGQWTMVANKDTTDRPAPQPIGEGFWLLPDAPAFVVTQPTVNQIETGHRYSFLTDAYIVAYRVWVAEVDPDIVLQPVLTNRSLPNEPKTFGPRFTPIAEGWTEITIAPVLATIGTVFDLGLIAKNTALSSTFNGNWNYTTPQNPGTPGSGNIIHPRGQPERWQISATDNDTNDRTTDLQKVDAGDIIIGRGQTWYVLDTQDNGTWFEFTVEPQVQGTAGVGTFQFEVFDPQPIDYAYITDYWLGSPSTQGYTSTDGAAPVLDANAYGTDMFIQPASLSPDWDVLATSASGAGGITKPYLPLNPASEAEATVEAEGDDYPSLIVQSNRAGSNPAFEVRNISGEYIVQALQGTNNLRVRGNVIVGTGTSLIGGASPVSLTLPGQSGQLANLPTGVAAANYMYRSPGTSGFANLQQAFRYFGKLDTANEPTAGMSGGDQYYNTDLCQMMVYCEDVSAWVTVAPTVLSLGRQVVNHNDFLEMVGGIVTSTTAGYPIPNGVVKTISIWADGTDVFSMILYNNGGLVGLPYSYGQGYTEYEVNVSVGKGSMGALNAGVGLTQSNVGLSIFFHQRAG